MCRNEEQLRASVKGSKEEQKLDTTEEFKRAVIDDLDKVDELQKEAARLQHEALKIYKKVVLKNIDYGWRAGTEGAKHSLGGLTINY